MPKKHFTIKIRRLFCGFCFIWSLFKLFKIKIFLLENARTQDFYSSQISKAKENQRFSIRMDV
ncbi:hypothetical protein DD829_04395 [Chryseobacterium sp. HMWF035]|nr:hypothetical protein DD829_04395 [Chryseobacterium sp. HMWF035]